MPQGMIRPEHEVCAVNVKVPTILIEPLRAGKKPAIFVQWFGESAECNLDGMQFKFSIPSSIEDKHWFGHPKAFQVILFDQTKNWPKIEARQMIIDSCGGDPEMWILWVTSSIYGTDSGPACFVVNMNILLIEDTCGIITPKRFLDLSVIEGVNKTWKMEAHA